MRLEDELNLKPCPFCGGKPFAYRSVNGTQKFTIGCASCGFIFETTWYRDGKAPLSNIGKRWNTRVKK